MFFSCRPGWLVLGTLVKSFTPAMEFNIIRRSDSSLAKACSTLMSSTQGAMLCEDDFFFTWRTRLYNRQSCIQFAMKKQGVNPYNVQQIQNAGLLKAPNKCN